MATKKVQGISVYFDADTTAYQTAVREVNKEMKACAKNADVLQQHLDLDPSSIKYTEQAIDNLGKAISLSEQKTEELNKELEHLTTVADDVPIEQITKLELAIKKSEMETEKLNSELSKVNGNVNSIDTTEIVNLGTAMEEAMFSSKELQKS